ncbi:MAG: hypothetical protein H7Z19_00435 [Chitinophagaceae bacterium]|nr:hypothetical protein [Rubrivivax sp.]
MNIYDMRIDDEASPAWISFYAKHELVMPLSADQEAEFFAGHPRIEVDRDTEFTPRESNARFGDYSNVNHNVHPVFSQRAKELLQPHLYGLGQWIELLSNEAPYWLFFVTNLVDALDVERSKVLYFTNSSKVMRIARYAFKRELLHDQWLFTLPQRPGSNRLVTDRFVDFAREHGLTGFRFHLLWSQEQGSVPDDMKAWERPSMPGLQMPDPRPLSIYGTSKRDASGRVIPSPF